ncbi:plasmid replication initiator TrfA (plasmid) [Candidatus Arsenophonus nilaparvatae]|uniref:plasmid replication initiator TrfA n=1 Tax=Candidatus Arsenophonus nilaparvatae TaxID=1247023 RepID=UPI0037BF343A
MKNIWDRVDFIANKISEKKDNCSEKNNPIKIPLKDNVYLPVTRTNRIPVPNTILRSALFGLVAKGKRKIEKRVLKSTLNGYTVRYSGEQLDQADLDVWLECLQRCQQIPLGNIVKFSSYEFLKSINRNTGKSAHEWLKSVFFRLKFNDIEISDGKYTYSGSLISEHFRDEETSENCLILNPRIVDCFGDVGWTGITKTLRLKLKGKPLTQWLYSFYSSHAKSFPIKVETIKILCGSEVSELKTFKQKLKKALLELSYVTDWHCEIDCTNKVVVKKVVKKNESI